MNKINFLFVVIVSGTVPDKGQITQDLISRDKTQLILRQKGEPETRTLWRLCSFSLLPSLYVGFSPGLLARQAPGSRGTPPSFEERERERERERELLSLVSS